MKQKTILIVEDDDKLRQELGLFLEKNGYQTAFLTDFRNSVQAIQATACDLILLDINLPFCDGEYILRELRKTSEVPVIMLTSRDSDMDELLSISLGADDYITKPFNTQILLARILAIFKRIDRMAERNVWKHASFALDVAESCLLRGEQKVELTGNERKILQCLMMHPGSIVSRDAIMDYLWDTDEFVDDNTLTVNMTRVRNKLESVGLTGLIVTKRGQGYLLK